MKKTIFTTIAILVGLIFAAIAFAVPEAHGVIHHIALLGSGSLLGIIGIIAQSSNATSTVFLRAASPHDMQVALTQDITGTGNQDSSQIVNYKQSGTIMKYQIAPSSNALNATTNTNQTTSVTTTLQPGVYFATNSVFAVNKLTLQAGLGIGGVLSATTGTLAINYLNVSSGALTPTQEANDVIEIKAGSLTTTAVLTPAAVSLNTSAEQIFTLATSAGQPIICLPGTVAIVNKPTSQTGLAYSTFARVVGINQVGITFAAVSSGVVTTAITPTAAETWNMAFLPALHAFNPTLIYGIPSGATATGASTTLEQTSGVTGILLSDTISGIARGTTQAGVFIGSYRVTSAGVIGITYGSVVTSSTPTTSEVLLATIQRQQPLNPMVIYNQALATSAIAATTSAEVTTTVTGLVVSTSVLVNKPSCTPGLLITNARVSAANTLAIQYTNLTTTSINVPTETYTIGNVQLQGPGLGITTTAGLFVAQNYYPSLEQTVTLAQGLLAALLAIDATSSVGASVTSN